jgi:hypothetical protein
MNNRRPLSRYRPPPHRSLRPLPPRWAEHEEAMRRSPLAQFILLSMLLHALTILLFGAPSGGSSEGRAMWGSLQVVIRGPLREDKPVIPAKDPVTAEASKKEPFTPNASKREPPVIPDASKKEPPVIPDASKEATVGKPASPPVPPLLTIPPEAIPERPPAFEVPPPIAAEPAPEPPEQPPAPASEIPAVQLPALPRLEQAAPLAIEPLPVPPSAPAPPPVPAPQRQIAPIELEALPRMEALPELPALPVEAVPRATEHIEAPPTAPPGIASPSVEPLRAEPLRVEPPIDTPAVRESPFRPPAPSVPIGPRGDAPPSDYDPTAAPSLDAEDLRRRAGEIARQGSGQRAVLAFPMPPIPERKTRLEEAIEKARKPDCRTAYQSLGLAAVIPLIANEFGEGSCRW